VTKNRRLRNVANAFSGTPSHRTLTLYQVAKDKPFRPIHSGTVKRYEGVYRSGATMPPIRVAEVDGVLILVDGWHRMAALEGLGIDRVEAEIVPASSIEEARWLAATANVTHGLPLKRGELRKVFRAYVRARKHLGKHKGQFKSYDEIAVELGRAKSTIYSWMRANFPKIARQMGGNDNFKGKGGAPDYEPTPPQLGGAQKGVLQVLSAFRSSMDHEERGAIIEMVEHVLEQMRGSGSWSQTAF
jgi:hypothetical protein